MELRILKYFLVVAREENITKAAKQLHITQPTLSRQLMQLENELGVSLFRRSKHSIILTEEGMLLRRRAQELIDLADKTAKEVSRQDEVISGEISIGCGETKCLHFLARMMAAFQQIYPEIRFLLYTGIADEVKERIDRGLLDFGVVIEPVDISKYKFMSTPVTDRWVVLMKDSDPLAKRTAVQPCDLAGRRLIIPGRSSVRNIVEHWFGRWQKHIAVSAFMNLSAYNKAVLVNEGVGVALGFDFDITYEGICSRPLDPPITNGNFIIWKKNQFISAAVERFIGFIAAYTEQQGHEGAEKGEAGKQEEAR